MKIIPKISLPSIRFKNQHTSSLISFLLILVIGYFDFLTGAEMSFSIFYLIPILFLVIIKETSQTIIVLNAFLASLVWFLADYNLKEYSHNILPFWNSFVRFVIFVLVGQLALNLNRKHKKLLKTNKELQKLNEEKNKLIGMAAHDLRNPIATIYSFSDLIISKVRNENNIEIIHYIKEISSNTLEMLEKLLDISKIESGTVEISFKLQNYVEFVENYVALNQMFANKKEIKIRIETYKKEIPLLFDEHYLSEVINNLLTNAIKFSYPNSEVLVRVTESKKKRIKTEVIDKGKGIPQEEQDKLFNYFQKTSTRPTAGEKSTGLGLAIAKKIVLEHNGQIGVVSEKNKGSNFFYELPQNSS
jgi:signal transduction histidine kinase